MSEFTPPLADINFALATVAELDRLAALPGFEEATPELVEQVLDEAGKFAGQILAPLNTVGDREGSRLENGVVRTPKGFGEAYRSFSGAGWMGLPFATEWGGQSLPWAVATATQELWTAANLSFSLCGLLTQGAIEALVAHGTPEQQATYLPKLVSGQWSGTMNLTEPQAGSDVGALRTRAVAEGDHYRITGQKIFITYGEQDLTENIVHLVLARTPDAPAGTKGISLFIVPKFLVRPDGTLGDRNDLRCLSLEEKLGIHASPTCVMSYGENGGAIGYRVGEERRGMEYMFTMMNNARLGVGVQGLGVAERAWQQARAYAQIRIQGRDATTRDPAPVPIVRHPDVRRMLLTMRATVEAIRALIYFTAAAIDRARRAPDAKTREREQSLAELLTPVAKAWSTDRGALVASLGVQVHGGVGFIESAGAAQHYRDARIAPIYEGTNGIQAADLVGRKLLRDEGAAMRALIVRIADALGSEVGEPNGDALRTALKDAVKALEAATRSLIAAAGSDLRSVLAGATPYLDLVGTVVAGWLLLVEARAASEALASGTGDPAFMKQKLGIARFFADNLLPQAQALATAATRGSEAVTAFEAEQI